jgi:hypothetical protein
MKKLVESGSVGQHMPLQHFIEQGKCASPSGCPLQRFISVEVTGQAAAAREDPCVDLQVGLERRSEVHGEEAARAVLGRGHDRGGGQAHLPESPH